MAFKMAGYSAFDKEAESKKNNENKKDYKHPSPQQQIEMAKIASEKGGKEVHYNPTLSERAGEPRFS